LLRNSTLDANFILLDQECSLGEQTGIHFKLAFCLNFVDFVLIELIDEVAKILSQIFEVES